MLSADDYGVMRFSAVTVQADNDALHARPSRTIQRCLERIVDLGLLVDFEHQKRKYVCQLDWQTWQRIKFPRHTVHPCPPPATLGHCDQATLGLFHDHHPVMRDAPLDVHQGDPLDVPLDAPQITAMANGYGNGNGLRERFSEFWRCYPRRVGKDAAWRVWQKLKPDTALLAQMLSVLAWQKQQDAWVKDGGQFIPHPATWLNQGRWEDEPTQQPRVNAKTVAIVKAGEEFLRS